MTKALAMHLADEVWNATERHLFPDASGKRFGMPRIGRWLDFTRLPGRARSHTKSRKWETFRLHGSLAGHRAAYTRSDGRFCEPNHLRGVASDAWWTHDGPLAVVFTGLSDGALVLPVRLPSAPSNQPMLDHHLADPSRWHKLDLVRHRDPSEVGGWRYEAHLMVLTAPYVAPAVAARRAAAAIATSERRAGIDVNVSNVTVASHVHGGDLQITRIEREAGAREQSLQRSRRERRQQRHLDRSRRASNRAQYQLSRRQDKRARRRAAAGLPPQDVIPHGPRHVRAEGVPLQAYRKDQLSRSYRQGRAALAKANEASARARRDHARTLAAGLVSMHGCRLTVEDCNLTAWARQWGRALAAFSPGTLVAAIEREAARVAELAGAGGVVRASTQRTALSQHCLCGARAGKTLGERVHQCQACGLRGDRDAVSATLAAFVVFGDRARPASATVDFDASRASLLEPATRTILGDSRRTTYQGWQDIPSESNAHSARDGFFVADPGRTPDLFVVARRIVGMASYPTPNEPGPCWTTSERTRTRTNMSDR
ncbi:MAG: transposase, partial [Candidatus Eisenbacteria bacterium]